MWNKDSPEKSVKKQENDTSLPKISSQGQSPMLRKNKGHSPV